MSKSHKKSFQKGGKKSVKRGYFVEKYVVPDLYHKGGGTKKKY